MAFTLFLKTVIQISWDCSQPLFYFVPQAQAGSTRSDSGLFLFFVKKTPRNHPRNTHQGQKRKGEKLNLVFQHLTSLCRQAGRQYALFWDDVGRQDYPTLSCRDMHSPPSVDLFPLQFSFEQCKNMQYIFVQCKQCILSSNVFFASNVFFKNTSNVLSYDTPNSVLQFTRLPIFLFKVNSVLCLLMPGLTWSAYLLNPHLSNFFQYLHFWWPVSRKSTFHPFFPSKISSSVSPSSI